MGEIILTGRKTQIKEKKQQQLHFKYNTVVDIPVFNSTVYKLSVLEKGPRKRG